MWRWMLLENWSFFFHTKVPQRLLNGLTHVRWFNITTCSFLFSLNSVHLGMCVAYMWEKKNRRKNISWDHSEVIAVVHQPADTGIFQSLDIFWFQAKITSIFFSLNLFFFSLLKNLYVSLRTKSQQTFPCATLYLLYFRSVCFNVCDLTYCYSSHVRRISLSSSINTKKKRKAAGSKSNSAGCK